MKGYYAFRQHGEFIVMFDDVIIGVGGDQIEAAEIIEQHKVLTTEVKDDDIRKIDKGREASRRADSAAACRRDTR